MMTEKEYESLWDGILVEYGFFTKMMYVGEDKKGRVIMRDREGNVKKVYRELFLKHAKMLP